MISTGPADYLRLRDGWPPLDGWIRSRPIVINDSRSLTMFISSNLNNFISTNETFLSIFSKIEGGGEAAEWVRAKREIIQQISRGVLWL